jgi:hypothetical protein
MDVSFDPQGIVFTQSSSGKFAKGNSHCCFMQMDKSDFCHVVFGGIDFTP